MIDIIALAVVLLVVLAVMLRRTSAGVGVLALLAGVLLDQLLSGWLIGLLPHSIISTTAYVPVVVHLLVTFVSVAACLIAVKISRPNVVLSLLTSLVLGFLIVFFGLKIIAPLPVVANAAANSGLLTFLNPYQNLILSASAVLALMEMVLSHRSAGFAAKKKR